ncbi:K+-transporting ATPase ATPase C chain [Jatrophihabitans endophyticus]|uniref:K+-transporting ATPase ATPase C chain n=2 Tax=Jatrophihabitans endophyticus TaxID=1206085 RepID=A0A1M5EI46_9ACTN|nr:K+-transporting ATPase ATPase C chain [Jatrophihabitans endophyticus]
MLLVFTVVLGIAYPLAVWAAAQLPGLQHRADGSVVTRGGRPVGSALIGQAFTTKDGDPLVQYLQPRPSAGGYDPTATGASNLGPESVVDTLPDPSVKADEGSPSLLTQVCTRSRDVGMLEHVDGRRPYCTPGGVGAVLAVFRSGADHRGRVTRVVSVNEACPATPFLRTYRGVPVECARAGGDYAKGTITPIRGDAPADPVVPADAVTASGSGVDPTISPAYATLQERRIAAARGITVAQVAAVVADVRSGRDLGFLGEPVVNVLRVNAALDERYPYAGARQSGP